MNVKALSFACWAVLACASSLRAEDAVLQLPDVLKLLEAPPATGLMVLFVEPGSQAEEVGIRRGDILLEYAGAPVASLDDLRRQAGGLAEASTAKIISKGQERSVEVRPGKLGLNVIPIKKGQPTALRPPATDVKFDFSALEKAPLDLWYNFYIDGRKCGVERHRLSVKDGELLLYSRVAFDGGPQWGVNDFKVEVAATAEPRPRLKRTRFEFVPAAAVTEGRRGEAKETPGLPWQLRKTGGGKPDRESETLLPDDAMADYLLAQLAPFMPIEKGACWHASAVIEASGEVIGPAGLLCAGTDTLEVDGEASACARFETHAMGRITRACWVDAKSRLVRSDYNGAVSMLTTRERALATLPESLKAFEETEK
ncbi:MAG: PDZ domain-containing protein [Planctomycetes bacterium]|nr:PDZ domain-containing protein [Planctomycetota bacterium]